MSTTPSTRSMPAPPSTRSTPSTPQQVRGTGNARRRAAVACYAARRAVLRAVIRSCGTPAEGRTPARARPPIQHPARPSGPGPDPRTAPPGTAG
ncbi:hypothetical protein AB0G35_20835 [Streptomyces sp. NPDC021749]|uniref:hypothetical protein n=1 Tax=Streptomyces sp. NPDC021749 TaxID=3154905 RepID=UPI0033C5E150